MCGCVGVWVWICGCVHVCVHVCMCGCWPRMCAWVQLPSRRHSSLRATANLSSALRGQALTVCVVHALNQIPRWLWNGSSKCQQCVVSVETSPDLVESTQLWSTPSPSWSNKNPRLFKTSATPIDTNPNLVEAEPRSSKVFPRLDKIRPKSTASDRHRSKLCRDQRNLVEHNPDLVEMCSTLLGINQTRASTSKLSSKLGRPDQASGGFGLILDQSDRRKAGPSLVRCQPSPGRFRPKRGASEQAWGVRQSR